jgi:hypothetical protein
LGSEFANIRSGWYAPWKLLLGADDIRGDVAELYGYVNRSLPDADLDAFVDALVSYSPKSEKRIELFIAILRLNIHGRRLTRIEGMSFAEKKKDLTEDKGDIRVERDPKPIPASRDVEEAEEVEDKEGNLPPAMPPGA